MTKYRDLTGKRFGLWTVLYGPIRQSGKGIRWHCKCDCGVEKDVFGINLTRGLSTSCGCKKCEALGKKRRTHGKRKTRLYGVWCNMRRRCYDKKAKSYDYYGGRGIGVCQEWLGKDGFQNFWDWSYANGYSENAPRGKCTIERIDVNGNYEPSNCIWATLSQQARNKTDTRFLTVGCITMSLQDWAEQYDIDPELVHDRIERGWDVDRALTEPAKKMCADVEYNGEVHSYAEWARILGIKKKTVQWRVEHGWSTAEVLSPVNTVHHEKRGE